MDDSKKKKSVDFGAKVFVFKITFYVPSTVV